MTSLMKPRCDLIMLINGQWKVVPLTPSGAARCSVMLLHVAEFIMTPFGEVLKSRYNESWTADKKKEGLEFYHRQGFRVPVKEPKRRGGGFEFL